MEKYLLQTNYCASEAGIFTVIREQYWVAGNTQLISSKFLPYALHYYYFLIQKNDLHFFNIRAASCHGSAHWFSRQCVCTGAATSSAILWGHLLIISTSSLHSTEEKESKRQHVRNLQAQLRLECKRTWQLILSEDFHSIKEERNEIVSEQKETKLFISY